MRILVLGSAAGGGFPQWNINIRFRFSPRIAMGGVTNK